MGIDSNPSLAPLIEALSDLRARAIEREREEAPALRAMPDDARPSGENLVHYLALREHDVRDLQRKLACLGLSSLGRLEADVLPTLDAVLRALRGLAGVPVSLPTTATCGVEEGHRRLTENTDALFGPPRERLGTRIMVTMPSEAANDPGLIRDLLAAGMSVMRINCAHDGPAAWGRMVEHLARAEQALGLSCRILCDLAGPKLRTGPIAPGAAVLRWKPTHGELGNVVAPARVRLVAGRPLPVASGGSGAPGPALPLAADLLETLEGGDTLRLTDARGRRRELLVEASEHDLWARADRGAYVVPGTRVEVFRDGERIARGAVGAIPPAPRVITVSPGELILVTGADVLGRPEVRDAGGLVVEIAQISCSLPEVFRDVRPGERVLFDDGRISGAVREKHAHALLVEVQRVSAAGGKAKLGADKGINLPDTALDVPFFTARDAADLDFVAAHAHMVGLSFVRDPEDIARAQRELAARRAAHVSIVLKIETRRAFEQLPRLLLAGLTRAPFAVMVARGDLGVELGFERLAEVQEEILWLAEAAHVPVVWATQVLEKLAKTGSPSRAEVTDAAMSARAECVMLNKGPHVVEAVRFLADVLARMGAHQEKKRTMLRRLRVSEPWPEVQPRAVTAPR